MKLAVSGKRRYNSGIENALRSSSVQGDGRTGAVGLIEIGWQRKRAVRVSLWRQVSGRLLNFLVREKGTDHASCMP